MNHIRDQPNEKSLSRKGQALIHMKRRFIVADSGDRLYLYLLGTLFLLCSHS